MLEDDKFYGRLLSKESSAANPSFRVYYGGASGAVPFFWESQPGTPKHATAAASLPPLTPPPSYFSTPTRNRSGATSANKASKPPAFILAILPKLRQRKVHISPSFSSSTTSSSSAAPGHRRWSSSSSLSHFSFAGGDHEEDYSDDLGSPTSTVCFGMGRRATGGAGGRRSATPMKKALLSMVGHRSGSGAAR
ncbi:hypothetical protein Cni_G15589 [Canna indica]|uniref:Uncharacterized protein n=1 Tax=Canna indica TaxID=4628 RepID=A0AAQ3QFX0_9LILI|nr:hypothetical protein Cni_G15589 [Canna indica]